MQKLKVETRQVMAGAERSGKDKGKRGKVLAIDRDDGPRARRGAAHWSSATSRRAATARTPRAASSRRPGSIALAAVQLVCPKCDKPTRVGIRVEGDKKVRFCKKCDATID